jgi:hypothetical protein
MQMSLTSSDSSGKDKVVDAKGISNNLELGKFVSEQVGSPKESPA